MSKTPLTSMGPMVLGYITMSYEMVECPPSTVVHEHHSPWPFLSNKYDSFVASNRAMSSAFCIRWLARGKSETIPVLLWVPADSLWYEEGPAEIVVDPSMSCFLEQAPLLPFCLTKFS